MQGDVNRCFDTTNLPYVFSACMGSCKRKIADKGCILCFGGLLAGGHVLARCVSDAAASDGGEKKIGRLTLCFHLKYPQE